VHKFGKRSLEKLETCHEDLQKIMKLAISRSRIDFGISEGHRSEERQLDLYEIGKSKVKFGKHNESPSMACDIYVWHDDATIRREKQYDAESLAYIAGIVVSCAAELKEKSEVKHDIRIGLNWDMDGEIVTDQSFYDGCHYEIVE
jgi:peptidoglycan L-alanyl-D-glutamate endopeptidase CwlK